MGQKLTSSDWDDLSAWFDGELPAERAKQIDAKVATEAAWADAHRELRNVDDALDAWIAPAPADDLTERIRQAARQQQPPRRGNILRLAIPVSAAAAAAVLIAVGASLMNPTPETSPRPSRTAATPVEAESADAIPDAFVMAGLDVFTVEPTSDSEDLRGRIHDITGGSLSDALGGSQTTKQRWAALTGQQQEQARQHALAFLQLDPNEQRELIDSYADAVAADPIARAAWEQRSRWLKVVLESFSPEQIRALQIMPPARRANVFIQRRDELRRQGKLD